MNENGFTSFLLGLVAAAALFLIWKKEHALVNGGGMFIQPQTQPQTYVAPADNPNDTCSTCNSCGTTVAIPQNQPIQTAQVSPQSGGSYPGVVPTVSRAPVNTTRIGIQYISPPRAAVTTGQAVRTPYVQRTSPIAATQIPQPRRLGPLVN